MEQRIRYFLPNDGQSKFIDEIKRPGAFIVVNGSGNGAGKSYGVVAILAALCYPEFSPSCFDADIFKKWPYPKRARIISTPKEVESIGSLQTAITELFPKGRYTGIRKGKSYDSQFTTDTGWIIDLMTYDQDKAEMAGPTIGLMIWNEPMPQELWNEGMARMRRGGLVLVAMTSLNDHPWVVDGILGKANGEDVRVVYNDVETNCKQHGINGTLDHAQIERILAQYDPDEREARKTGKPLSMSGRIYKGFDRSVHVASEPISPDAEAVTHYMVVDPAIGKPLAVIWAYVDATGTLSIYREYPEADFEGSKDSNLTVSDYIDLFKRLENGKKIDERIIDRHFANSRRTLGGKTLKEEFSEHNFDFSDSYTMESTSEVETGILKVKDYLRHDVSKPMDSLNRPKLIISPECRNTILAFERWGRNPDTGKPKENYKDFADVVRYLCMADPERIAHSPAYNGRQPHYGVGN